jgi:hypothetical protein
VKGLVSEERSQSIFDSIEQSLKVVGGLQKEEALSGDEEWRERVTREMKTSKCMVKETEAVAKQVRAWTESLLGGVRKKMGQWSETQKQLELEQTEKQSLSCQLTRLQQEGSHSPSKDSSLLNELHHLQLTILHKDSLLKDVYHREDRLNRHNHKIKVQLDQLLKEQERLVSEIKQQVKEREQT